MSDFERLIFLGPTSPWMERLRDISGSLIQPHKRCLEVLKVIILLAEVDHKGPMENQKTGSKEGSLENKFDYDVVLLDIEGTTTPISFVKVLDTNVGTLLYISVRNLIW